MQTEAYHRKSLIQGESPIASQLRDQVLPHGSSRRTHARLLLNHVRSKNYPWRNQSSFANPFFIVGSGRCGTTLLRRLLQASPDVHIPPENWAVASWVREFGDSRNLLNWDELSGLLLSSLLLKNQGWFDDYPVDLLEQATEIPEAKRSLADLVDYFYRFHGNHIGATFNRWGDKTPLNINNMSELKRIFPEAKFIFMLRDPADVVYSWSQTPKYLNAIKEPAQRWANACAHAQMFCRKHAGSMIEVRYEDLVTSSAETMARITDFLDLGYDANWINDPGIAAKDLQDAENITHLKNALKKVTTESIGKGRSNLTPKQLELLQDTIGQQCAEAGYASFV